MAERWNEDEVWNDGRKGGCKRGKAYSELDDAQYSRCILREKIIQLGHSMTPRQFMAWLAEHEREIKSVGFSHDALAEMRRSVDGRANTMDDIDILNRVFGPLVRPEPIRVISSCEPPRSSPSLTPAEEMDYICNCTYEHIWNWIHSLKGVNFIASLSDSEADSFRDRIFDAMMRDAGLPRQRHLEDGDIDEMFGIFERRGSMA